MLGLDPRASDFFLVGWVNSVVLCGRESDQR